MNPRKTFAQMTSAERTTFLDNLTTEITELDDNLQYAYNPVKKAILEKIISYARDTLVAPYAAARPKPIRYDMCDKLFQARHLATLCFLEAVIEEVSKIDEPQSKLKSAVLDEATQRLAVMKESHKSILSGFSIGLVTSSAVLFWYDWPAAILLALQGVLLNKYSDGIVDIRVAQALKEQQAALLLQEPENIKSIEGDFGDSIERAQQYPKEKIIAGAYATAGFFSRQWNRYVLEQQPDAIPVAVLANDLPAMNQ